MDIYEIEKSKKICEDIITTISELHPIQALGILETCKTIVGNMIEIKPVEESKDVS